MMSPQNGTPRSGPAPQPEPQFGFERRQRKTSRRSRNEADMELAQLLRYLELGDPDAARLRKSKLSNLLLRYTMELPLNISWYMQKVISAQAQNNKQRIGAISLVVAALAFTVIILLVGPGKGWFNLSAANLATYGAFLSTALIGIGQTLNSASDTRAQIASFWKASSDLKEQLYSFIETWRNRVDPSDPHVMAEWEAALWAGLKEARRIVSEERSRFFATLKSPSEILSAASGLLDTLRGRQKEVLTVLTDAGARPSLDRAQVVTASKALLDADAGLKAAEALLRTYQSDPAVLASARKEELQEQAKLAVLKAQADKEHALHLLRALGGIPTTGQ